VEAAIARYRPDGFRWPSTANRAEVLGCQLAWADQTPPAVRSHPLSNGHKLEELRVPGPIADGSRPFWLPRRQLSCRHPDVALYGLVTGPFTLALHLLGTDIFMNMFDAPDYVGE